MKFFNKKSVKFNTTTTEAPKADIMRTIHNIGQVEEARPMKDRAISAAKNGLIIGIGAGTVVGTTKLFSELGSKAGEAIGDGIFYALRGVVTLPNRAAEAAVSFKAQMAERKEAATKE